MRLRLRVAAAAWAAGAFLALFPAVWLGFATGGLVVVPVAWLLVLLGPTAALVDAEIAASVWMPVRLGWVGFFLMPAHPLFPTRTTAWLTAVGAALWFLAGGAVFLALVRPG